MVVVAAAPALTGLSPRLLFSRVLGARAREFQLHLTFRRGRMTGEGEGEGKGGRAEVAAFNALRPAPPHPHGPIRLIADDANER